MACSAPDWTISRLASASRNWLGQIRARVRQLGISLRSRAMASTGWSLFSRVAASGEVTTRTLATTTTVMSEPTSAPAAVHTGPSSSHAAAPDATAPMASIAVSLPRASSPRMAPLSGIWAVTCRPPVVRSSACASGPLVAGALRPHHVQLHRLAGQLLKLGAEPVGLGIAVAARHARPGGVDLDPDVVQVPEDRDRGYPGRPSYPPAYHVVDLLDAQLLDGQDLRSGGDPGLLRPGQLEVVGQQPVRHAPPARLIRRRIGPGRRVGELQVHMRIQVDPQRQRRLAWIMPRDHAAGDGVLLPGLGHPGPDLLLERAVVSHAMSLAAMPPRAPIAWLSGD